MAQIGRPKAIESPEKLWEYFELYRHEIRLNPIERKVKGNKGFILSHEELRRPLTMEGFEMWCHENEIISDLGDYFSNKDERYSDFATICQLIKKAIRQDQIEGGMAGIYNPSITQRLNGLTDKTQQEISGPNGGPVQITGMNIL